MAVGRLAAVVTYGADKQTDRGIGVISGGRVGSDAHVLEWGSSRHLKVHHFSDQSYAPG